MIKKFVQRRSRLVITLGLGIFSAFLLPDTTPFVTRALSGWNIGVWAYLILMALLMTRASQQKVRRMAQEEDESAIGVLVLLSLSAIISLMAIIHELSGLSGLPSDERIVKYLFAASTVLGSWTLLAVIFCFHYALLFYNAPEDKRALAFPDGEELPDFWDFLYFSFTIAVAAQTSDVTVMSRSARKTVLAQSVLSFFFNIAVLGFSINIAASLVSS
ncbi:DUF1345 domain-containing protein [Undibacterium sp. TJN19]|uniref:DUF1345 domain-containing protein n=1 Tax=Undibacterium sp. TJN19 TaxID=3413055 RepID=UPI003BEFF031